MPTSDRKEWVPAALPPDLKPDEDVFVVSLTGEVFRHYKDYVRTMDEYRSHQWACKFTGKKGLTFQEALLEETSSTNLLKEVRS